MQNEGHSHPNLIANSSHVKVVSPARVNLLGERVDYNDGIVLPAAINLTLTAVFHYRADDMVSIQSTESDEAVLFSLNQIAQRVDQSGSPLPDWSLYPAGVAWALQNKGFLPCGVDVEIISDIPIGAGLSSSAALELAFAAYWNAFHNWNISRMELAQICQFAENRFVGVQCGLMDQFACAHGVARHALMFDVRNLQWQPIPIPHALEIVIVDSGIRRSLKASGYNLRREECEQALSILKEEIPEFSSLRDIQPEKLDFYATLLPNVLFRRVHHVVEEIERVKQACSCLVRDDAAGFGKLMNAGHASLRDLFEVSLPAIDNLVAQAISIDGCLGARLTGAGFGGCTVNLVRSAAVPDFIRDLKNASDNVGEKDIRFYCCKPSRGVYVENLA